MKNIVVIGGGYVGLVTGACLAQKDNKVIVIEKDEEKIQSLMSGKVPFYEPGLDTLVAEGIASKKLSFVQHVCQVMDQNPEIIFSCVGTPSLQDGSADLSYVWQVAQEIGQHMSDYCLVINKSTVPVGTAKKVKSIIQECLDARGVDLHVDVASNPEFLKEGTALDDFLYPDRVVVGTESEKAETLLRNLYAPFLTHEDQFIAMNIASAELTKYASNAMLATRITFMNQIALLADQVGADVEEVKKGMSKDQRIGPHFLNAGIGYGGSCFPKDVRALIHMGIEHFRPMTVVREVDRANDHQRIIFFDQILKHYGKDLSHKRVAIWGLAFKPETDDIRCAPSLDVIKKFLSCGVAITAYDPVAQNNVEKVFGSAISFASTPQRALLGADFLVIFTEWAAFKTILLQEFDVLSDKTIFDGRNCFDPVLMHEHGLAYVCIGRNSLVKKEVAKSVEKTEKIKQNVCMM
ncbi:MAG: UDP-glucose/GDP-mannose dehydrogenase family protein [bacterium]